MTVRFTALAKSARTPDPDRSQSWQPGSLTFSEQAWTTVARSLKLSARELQIVRGIFDDRKEFAIAADLGIAPRTVHTHVERLHKKLHVSSRVQVVLRLTNEILLTAPPGPPHRRPYQPL